MNEVLDLRVTIERVHVRTAVPPDHPQPPAFVAGYLGAHAGAPPHDHRIAIRALRIDVEAELDEPDARRLGQQVAWELAGQLAELQDQRRPRIARTHSAGGPIHVETLRVYLRGEIARHPSNHEISAALIEAFEEGVRDA